MGSLNETDQGENVKNEDIQGIENAKHKKRTVNGSVTTSTQRTGLSSNLIVGMKGMSTNMD